MRYPASEKLEVIKPVTGLSERCRGMFERHLKSSLENPDNLCEPMINSSLFRLGRI